MEKKFIRVDEVANGTLLYASDTKQLRWGC